MKYNGANLADDFIAAVKRKEISKSTSLQSFFAKVLLSGKIKNLTDIDWKSFSETFFFEDNDVILIDEINNHQLKLAVLDFWIKHRNLVLRDDVWWSDKNQEREAKWKSLYKALQNQEQYDISSILKQNNILRQEVAIIKKQLNEINKEHYLDIIITENRTPEEIKEIEKEIKNTLDKGNTAIAKKLIYLNNMGEIDINDIPDTEILNSINRRFGKDIKYSAFHKAMEAQRFNQKQKK